MEANQIKIKTLCLSLATVLIVEAAIRAVFSTSHLAPMVGLGIARLFEAVLLIMIVRAWGHGLLSIGLAGHQIIPGIRKGLIWSIAFGIAVSCIAGVLYLVGLDPLALVRVQFPGMREGLISLYLVAGVVGPITEEILFRGILYGFLRRWGVAAAISLSTVLFVLPHLTETTLPFVQMVGGVLFAAAYEVERKLTVPITIHALGNIALITLSVLA